MKIIKSIVKWIGTQFQVHTVYSLLITITAAALVTAGILWIPGLFKSAETSAYLPDREYILAPVEYKEPQTLEELLHVRISEPDVDTLLRNPAIAEELMKAEKLTDVVDSRLALNNLRNLDQQLAERIEQMQKSFGKSNKPDVTNIELAGMSSETAETGNRPAGAGSKPAGTSNEVDRVGSEPAGTSNEVAGVSSDLAGTGGEHAGTNGESSKVSADTISAAIDNTADPANAPSAQEEQMLSVKSANAPAAPANLSGISTNLQEMSSFSHGIAIQATGELAVPEKELEQLNQLLSGLKNATGRLLEPKEYSDDLVSIPSAMNMKAIWQSPDEALVHMTPSGDWIPEQGYKLYRKVEGQEVLINESALSPVPILSGEIQIADADMIKALYKQAELTPEKLKVLDMTAEEFRDKAYRVDSLTPKERIGGKVDFLAMKEALITVPASMEQKIPQTDIMFGFPIYIQDNISIYQHNFSELKINLMQKFSLVHAAQPTGIRGFTQLPDGAKKVKLTKDIMSARQQISTLAFVDDEFAEKAGFLVRDDLSALNLSNGTRVQYIVEMPDGSRSFVNITHGEEKNLTKPQELMGYGIDGKVMLRWDVPQDEEERSIVSGYHIERKLEDETSFTKITEQPVAISYILDEHDMYFELPVFFEDEVEDGLTAEYRIYSIDVFGRSSEYSDAASVTVYRVTPPNAPVIESPALSGKPEPVVNSTQMQGTSANTGESSVSAVSWSGVVHLPGSVLQDAMELNKYKPGIVLPIFTDTPDTVRFTIYRAKAVGAESFGPPEILADISYDNPRPPKPQSFVDEGEDDEFDAGPSQIEMLDTAASSSSQKELKRSEDDGDGGTVDSRPDQMKTLNKPASPKTMQKKSNKGIHVVLAEYSPHQPDLVYFDSDVEEGCTYKYWVSAWDKWNNESAWSQSVTMGIPTKKEPEIPKEIDIAMHVRRLPDRSFAPPGMLVNGPIQYAKLPNSGAKTLMSGNIEWSYAGVDFPDRNYPDGAVLGTVENAIADKARIGGFLLDDRVPAVIDAEYDNLPDRKYIHKFVGVKGEDVLSGGIAVLRWPAYTGEGLEGYAVYRPLFTPKALEEMQQMSYSELVAMGRWQLVNDEVIKQNQLMLSGLDDTPGSLSLFLVLLEPEKEPEDTSAVSDDESLSADLPEGGHVFLSWDKPDDPQVQYYRVYRSEVPSFKEPVDESKLDWTLVGDRIEHNRFTHRVEQSFAHYYYYKITSVSPWGVESMEGRIQRFRVPATKPPDTPNLLLPLSTKDGVKINFSAVRHCDRYEIWRTPIPIHSMEEVKELAKTHPELYEALFGSPDTSNEDFINNYFDTLSKERESAQSQYVPMQFASRSGESVPMQLTSGSPEGLGFMSMPFTVGLSNQEPAMSTAAKPGLSNPSRVRTLNPVGKFKTLSIFNISSVKRNLEALSLEKKLNVYNIILDKYGPLAIADYSQLSWEMSRRVNWEKIGEILADYTTTETVDPATGLLKPLSFTDKTAQYGVLYLYTVQAWNDDNLGSTRPEPVIATPRRNGPFDPIDGLKGEIVNGVPTLVWNTPKMKNVLPEKCLEDTVGYIVYRSDTRDGTYYQASPLLFENRWVDTEADRNAFNWYKVKVLDTGGYLSDFSEPVLIQQTFITDMVTVIPKFDLPDNIVIAPRISFDGRRRHGV